ncbi:acid protease [Meredithblackwellia eburnea MCA 4105]
MVVSALVTIVLLAAQTFALPAPSSFPSSGTYTAPIFVRRGLTPRSAEDLVALRLDQLEETRLKFNLGTLALGREKREFERLSKRAPAEGEVSLAGQYDVAYGQIEIGTPPVPFNVLFDTGSPYLVVASTNTGCRSCTYTGNLYNASLSSTAQVTSSRAHLVYGTGEVWGDLVYDQVRLAGFQSQMGLIAGDNNTRFSQTPQRTGIMGLSWARTGVPVPFIQALWQAGSLLQPLFGFAHARLPGPVSDDGTRTVSGGYFTIGALNTSFYSGEINWIPKGTTGWWDIPVQNMAVMGRALGFSYSQAIMDTGTNMILLDQKSAQAIYNLIPGGQPIENAQGLYAYQCTAQVNLQFQIGGATYTIDNSVFNWGELDSEYCVGAITSIESDSGEDFGWILGTPFLQSFYTAWRFDPPAFGLAALNDSRNLLSQSPIPTAAVRGGTNQNQAFRFAYRVGKGGWSDIDVVEGGVR